MQQKNQKTKKRKKKCVFFLSFPLPSYVILREKKPIEKQGLEKKKGGDKKGTISTPRFV